MTTNPPPAEPEADSSAGLRRFLRQQAEVSLLLGVDFLPVATGAKAPAPVKAPAAEPAMPAAIEVETKPADSERARRQALLDELRARHDAQCPHCTCATAHTRTVFGEGDPCAALVFVGEAPGAEEDRTGRPFVGRAGQKLNDMIVAMGLTREAVYICNVLKARPLDNATPTPEEAERCGVYLREQLRVIRPRVIVALGRPAAHYLLGTRDSMTNLRGRWAEYSDGETQIPVMPTFHPSFLLRQYTRENREKVWSDLQKALERLRG